MCDIKKELRKVLDEAHVLYDYVSRVLQEAEEVPKNDSTRKDN